VADIKPALAVKPPTVAVKTVAKKLSFKEQREYDSLPTLIAQLEQEQSALNLSLADGSLYASDPKAAADKASRVSQIDDEVLQAMERLETLSLRTPSA
jgi:ATP-binding cassette subfamily F protein uup